MLQLKAFDVKKDLSGQESDVSIAVVVRSHKATAGVNIFHLQQIYGLAILQ
jgi:hypothetical protein